MTRQRTGEGKTKRPLSTEPQGTPQNWAVGAILQERKRQDEKWGRQKHENRTWETIVLEEFGEVAKAMLERGEVRKELIQMAAVCLAWLEDGFERGEFPMEEYGEFNQDALKASLNERPQERAI